MKQAPVSRRSIAARLGVGVLSLAILGVGSSRADSPGAEAKTFIFLVFSDPAAGQAEAYDGWNTDENLAKTPGFVSARRFVYSDVQIRNPVIKVPRHLTLYTVKTDDPAQTLAQIKRRTLAGRDQSPSPVGDVVIVAYKIFRPEMTGLAEPAGAGAPETDALLVFQDAVSGQDDAFNAWYDKVHAPELLAIPGFVGAQRAIYSGVDQAKPIYWPRYLVTFRVVTHDLGKVFQAALAGGPPSPALDRTTSFGYTYRALGPEISGR